MQHFSFTEPGEDYVNIEKDKDASEGFFQTKPIASNGKFKTLLLLIFFIKLIALCAICVLVILYLNKVAAFDTLLEQHNNITAKLSMEKPKVTEKQQMCEQGRWLSLGLKHYFFSDIKLNWRKSQDVCIEKEGHLVIITSQAEQEFLSSENSGTMWIGLNDLEIEGTWVWVNNQPLNDSFVKFWHKRGLETSEPDNWKKEDSTGENCASLGHYDGFTDQWFDDSCKKLKKFICEKSLN